MRLLIWMFCAMTLLFSDTMPSKQFAEKLIVYYDTNEAQAKAELLKLKVYFIENESIRTLQEQHHLVMEIDTLDGYYMVTLKPVVSLDVRNELLIILKPLFKDIFFIAYETHTPSMTKNPKSSKTVIPIEKQKTETSLIDEIGLQWLALLLLSLVGLLLSIASRKKIIHLGKNQKDLKEKQTYIEREIQKLGAENA